MILNRQRQVRVALRPLDAFLSRAKDALGLHNTDVTICMMSDAEIARMNQAFRKKRGPTDVLSFPTIERQRPVRVGLRHRAAATAKGGSQINTSPARRVESAYLGDIAISPATARRNAKLDRRSLQSELRILILHGLLHLLGYDHETDQGQMERIERRLRQRFGLA